jgi:hypothetical protein
MIIKLISVVGVSTAITLLLLLFVQKKANLEVQRIEQMLWSRLSEPTLFTQEMIYDLPKPMQRYFRHAIAPLSYNVIT